MKIKEFKGMKLVLYAMLFFSGVNCSSSDPAKEPDTPGNPQNPEKPQATNDVDFYLTKGMVLKNLINNRELFHSQVAQIAMQILK